MCYIPFKEAIDNLKAAGQALLRGRATGND